jgi:hypothetical protein
MVPNIYMKHFSVWWVLIKSKRVFVYSNHRAPLPISNPYFWRKSAAQGEEDERK